MPATSVFAQKIQSLQPKKLTSVFVLISVIFKGSKKLLETIAGFVSLHSQVDSLELMKLLEMAMCHKYSNHGMNA